MTQTNSSQDSAGGLLILIAAASGTGKTSLIKALRDEDQALKLSISYTTRPIRPGETNGLDYHFISKEAFMVLVQDGKFIEHAEVFGHLYGTGLAGLEAQLSATEDMLLEIDWQGAFQVKKIMPRAISIFLLPPSITQLETRLKSRGEDNPRVIKKRLAGAALEISHCDKFDYLVVNDEFENARQELIAIIKAERARTTRRRMQLADLLSSITPDGDAGN